MSWLPAGGKSPTVDVVSPGTACPTTTGDLPEDSCSHSGEDGGACGCLALPSPLPPLSSLMESSPKEPSSLFPALLHSAQLRGSGTCQSSSR